MTEPHETAGDRPPGDLPTSAIPSAEVASALDRLKATSDGGQQAPGASARVGGGGEGPAASTGGVAAGVVQAAYQGADGSHHGPPHGHDDAGVASSVTSLDAPVVDGPPAWQPSGQQGFAAAPPAWQPTGVSPQAPAWQPSPAPEPVVQQQDASTAWGQGAAWGQQPDPQGYGGYPQQGFAQPPAPKRPSSVTASFDLVAAATAVVLVAVGVSIPEDGSTAWGRIGVWAAFGIVAAALTLAVPLATALSIGAERAKAAAVVGGLGLAGFWVLFVLPSITQNTSFVTTLGCAAGGGVAWLANGRAAPATVVALTAPDPAPDPAASPTGTAGGPSRAS